MQSRGKTEFCDRKVKAHYETLATSIRAAFLRDTNGIADRQAYEIRHLVCNKKQANLLKPLPEKRGSDELPFRKQLTFQRSPILL